MSLLKRIEKHKLFQRNKIKYKELTNIKKLRYNTNVAQKSGVKIFVKEIPIAKKYSITNTKNVYNIPTKYNYGVGSYGINPFRELKLCQITTDFVLFTNIYKIVKHKKHKKLIQYLIKNKRNINKIRKIFNTIYF
jgi:hypothetical protein